MDWAAVVTGQKRMFRTLNEGSNPAARVIPEDVECPRPCLIYSPRRRGAERHWDAKPAVLLSHRQEPLSSISAEDLAAEGFEFLPAFKWYWQQRYRKRGWRPWDVVSVIELRLWEPHDRMEFAESLLLQLYAEWFPEDGHPEESRYL